MSVVGPQPNPETIEVLLDTSWRLAAAETGRTDALDRKAATVATFSSLVAALTATVGIRFVEELGTPWALALFLGGLAALVGAVVLSVAALRPREYLTFGTEYVRRLPTWSEILKPPEQTQGEIVRTLAEVIVRERETNRLKVELIGWSFALLQIGLVLVAVEGATLAVTEVFE